MNKINFVKGQGLIKFDEPTGSVFMVDAKAFAGVRLYEYTDKKTLTTKYALKLFFDMTGQEPIVYNGYTEEAQAVEDLNELLKALGK